MEAKAPGCLSSFRYAADGEEHLYDVCRTWKVSDGRLREDLRVFQDGVPDQWLSDNWPQLVEELFPLDISQLFFFDAEKIRSLAEDESSSKALGAAIKSLLGLDIVERLITDSTVLQARLAKRAGTPEHQAQVELLEQALQQHQARLSTLLTESAALENDRLRAETDLKLAEEAFAASGGKHWEARQQRNRRLGDVASQEESLKGQLVNLAAGDLPLALVPDLSDTSRARRARVPGGGFRHDPPAIGGTRSTSPGGDPGCPRQRFLSPAGDRPPGFGPRQPPAQGASRPHIEPLGGRRVRRSRHLRSQRLAAHQHEARLLLKRLAKVTREREDLERANAATPDDAEIERGRESVQRGHPRICPAQPAGWPTGRGHRRGAGKGPGVRGAAREAVAREDRRGVRPRRCPSHDGTRRARRGRRCRHFWCA